MKFWLRTREIQTVRSVFQEILEFPEYLIARVSPNKNDGKPPKGFPYTSSVVTGGGDGGHAAALCHAQRRPVPGVHLQAAGHRPRLPTPGAPFLANGPLSRAKFCGLLDALRDFPHVARTNVLARLKAGTTAFRR